VTVRTNTGSHRKVFAALSGSSVLAGPLRQVPGEAVTPRPAPSYTTDFATHEQARLALFEYIEVFYNLQRRHSTLGYASPTDFELAALPQKLAA